MKRTILNVMCCLGLIAAVAQPTTTQFPDFTVHDIEGNEHHLQSYLDQGKTVVIDVFATWCTNCQSSASGMEELYNTYGQGGDQSMVILTFERDASTSNEAQYVTQYNVQSPVIAEAPELIADVWNITYQPRYFVICPDGTFQFELFGPIFSDPQPLIDFAENCEEVTGLPSQDLEDTFKLISSTFETNIIVESSGSSLQYSLLDLTGSVVSKGVIASGRNEIEASALPKGMFLLQVTDGTRALTKRLIKTS